MCATKVDENGDDADEEVAGAAAVVDHVWAEKNAFWNVCVCEDKFCHLYG